MSDTAPRDVAAVSGGTRERLLAAALGLVEEGGYAAASVKEISERVGVTNSALYRHFPSKAELCAELFRRVCSGELAAMEAAAQRGADLPVPDRVQTVLMTFAGRALANPRLAWALIAEPVDPLVEAERLAYRRRYRENLAGLLREGIADGSVPDQDPDLIAAALVGAVGEALVGPVSPLVDPLPRKEDVMSALQAFVRRAIGTSA